MKKIICILLSMFVLFSLVSCEILKDYVTKLQHSDSDSDGICDNCTGECPYISIVSIYIKDGKNPESEYEDSKTVPIVDDQMWEPGYCCVRTLKLENNTDNDVESKLSLTSSEENVSRLVEVIDVYYFSSAKTDVKNADLTENIKIGTLEDVLNQKVNIPSASLSGKCSTTITLVFKMVEFAGNEYQNLDLEKIFIKAEVE